MPLLEKLRTVFTSQWHMAEHFYANPQTRTPILIVWVASFGGALHASVTTYFYLEIGASDMDIGRIGFIQSLGLLLFSPLLGYALDHGLPVFGPLLVTAAFCSLGCLFRGVATHVMALYIAAGILSLGANLWTVVLLQVTYCTPREHRSHVLSGFAVQETGLRLLGKTLFPFWDCLVRATLLNVVPDYNTTLFRYRIHMGICTLFCLFGTVALLVERSALQHCAKEPTTTATSAASQPHQPHHRRTSMDTATSRRTSMDTHASLPSTTAIAQTPQNRRTSVDTTTTISLQQQQQQNQHRRTSMDSTAAASMYSHSSSPASLELSLGAPEPAGVHLKPSLLHNNTSHPPLHPSSSKNSNFCLYVAILSALLIQSWSSTVLIVLWPLVLRDLFQFAATEYGVIVVVASICSTGAIASFPTLEHALGRIRTAACGATVACAACGLAFVVLPNLLLQQQQQQSSQVDDPDAVPLDEPDDARQLLLRRQAMLVHVVLAIVFEASVRMLEPSLKSILSLTVPVSAQNRSLGFMSTLGGLGGMGGNLMGTWLFHQSNNLHATGIGSMGSKWLGHGTLPFAAVAMVLGLASVFLWALEWEESRHLHHSIICEEDPPTEVLCEEGGILLDKSHNNGAPRAPGISQSHSSGNNLEGQHHERVFFPLMQVDTTYQMKLD